MGETPSESYSQHCQYITTVLPALSVYHYVPITTVTVYHHSPTNTVRCITGPTSIASVSLWHCHSVSLWSYQHCRGVSLVLQALPVYHYGPTSTATVYHYGPTSIVTVYHWSYKYCHSVSLPHYYLQSVLLSNCLTFIAYGQKVYQSTR